MIGAFPEGNHREGFGTSGLGCRRFMVGRFPDILLRRFLKDMFFFGTRKDGNVFKVWMIKL